MHTCNFKGTTRVLRGGCSRSCRDGKRAFTIVELLVVIVIIAILAAVSLPMYSRYRTNAGIVVTKNIAKNLELAIRAYEEEYREWPADGGELKGDIVRLLRGESIGDKNFREIVFYETEENEITPPGPGNEVNAFEFAVDSNYDNTVTGPDNETLNRPVIVWAGFYDHNGNFVTTVKSWE